MFTILSFALSFVVATILAFVLHGTTRKFVRSRLRYVDAVQKGIAPFIAGGATLLVSALVVSLIPFVGIGVAITAALAVGSGVAAGARDIRTGNIPIVYGA